LENISKQEFLFQLNLFKSIKIGILVLSNIYLGAPGKIKNMIQRYKRAIILLIKAIISITIIFFIIRYVKININGLNKFEFRFNYYYLTISFIILLIYILNQSFLWYYITIQNNCNIDLRTSIKSRVYSEFGKYVPGKVFGYAMLFYVYSKANQSKTLVAFCMFFELLASVLAASMIFLFSLFFTEIQDFQKYRIIALFLLVVFFILIHPRILNYFIAIFLKIAKREPVKLNMTYYQLFKIVSLYVANFMVFGIGLVLFINSIYPVSFSNYLFITGIMAGAGLIGLFAIFVPAGLGVREGILTLALKEIMPITFAGVISLASRVWLILGEIILFFMVFIYNLYLKKVSKNAIEIRSFDE
jgi:uncharacterized membrane protein YbhN (UPF0104 family)